MKGNLGKASALENFFVHLAVAAVVSALTTGRVEDDFTVELARDGIEMHIASLHLECAVHGVQRVAQGELGRSLFRIAHQRYRLSVCCDSEYRAHKANCDRYPDQASYPRCS